MTTLDVDFDDAVLRISTSYDDRGRVELVTQWDDDAVGQGNVVNEVQYAYDGWGNMVELRQDRNSAVDAVSSVDDYAVAYDFVKNAPSDGRHTLRRSSMTLPDGRTLQYSYVSVGGALDDDLSMVSGMTLGVVKVVEYSYNGAGQVVGARYLEPNVSNNSFGTTSGSYPALDQFNRVVSSTWTKNLVGGNVHFYDIDITYDENSNIVRVIDNVHEGFDVGYTMDDLNRLIDAEEGTWSGSAITDTTRQQNWILDHAGNWENMKLDLSGGGSGWDEDEDRAHNKANELEERDIASGPTHNLAYDPVGNLIDDGKAYKYVYDAFGRLRKMLNQSDELVAEYVYNGLGHRIGVHYDVNVDGDVDGDDVWYWFAYDERWRIVGTFRDDAANIEVVVVGVDDLGLGDEPGVLGQFPFVSEDEIDLLDVLRAELGLVLAFCVLAVSVDEEDFVLQFVGFALVADKHARGDAGAVEEAGRETDDRFDDVVVDEQFADELFLATSEEHTVGHDGGHSPRLD